MSDGENYHNRSQVVKDRTYSSNLVFILTLSQLLHTHTHIHTHTRPVHADIGGCGPLCMVGWRSLWCATKSSLSLMTWRTIIVYPVETDTNLISYAFVRCAYPPASSARGFQRDYYQTPPHSFFLSLHPSIMISCGLINLIGSGVITTSTAHTLLPGNITSIMNFSFSVHIFLEMLLSGFFRYTAKWVAEWGNRGRDLYYGWKQV